MKKRWDRCTLTKLTDFTAAFFGIYSMVRTDPLVTHPLIVCAETLGFSIIRRCLYIYQLDWLSWAYGESWDDQYFLCMYENRYLLFRFLRELLIFLRVKISTLHVFTLFSALQDLSPIQAIWRVSEGHQITALTFNLQKVSNVSSQWNCPWSKYCMIAFIITGCRIIIDFEIDELSIGISYLEGDLGEPFTCTKAASQQKTGRKGKATCRYRYRCSVSDVESTKTSYSILQTLR